MGLSPLWVGVLITAGLIGILLVAEGLTGRLAIIYEVLSTGNESYLQTTGPDPFGFTYLVIHLLLVGYAPTAVGLIARAARRYADELSPSTDEGTTTSRRIAAVGRYPTGPAISWGLATVFIAVATPMLDVAVWRDHLFNPFDPADMTPEIVAQRIFSIVFGFFIGQLAYCAAVESWRFNRLAAEVREDQLLNRQILTPFTRLGLNNVLVVAIFPAILLLFLFNASLAPIILVLCAVAFVIAVAGLLGPLLGIHSRVAAAKREQLAWVNAELAKERQRLQGGEGARFAELMSYRAFVESVREWPLDGSTLVRLALYLAIPLFSWVGAAMVERLVDAALG
jgi:hypothetical protein